MFLNICDLNLGVSYFIVQKNNPGVLCWDFQSELLRDLNLPHSFSFFLLNTNSTFYPSLLFCIMGQVIRVRSIFYTSESKVGQCEISFET